ncbi:aminotransferase class V-fold PLP-dependent enzyme [Marinobacter panjinensis]|uniref:Aminotransferase class V-fold PLP-dependent enzyme n=1 Tax=Marinobacter panjinensis TaxID=2576384 RepID=A0A4U6QZ59_9GAMM|nr:aminotransferase class V-fold PLP-dependent enzyme [Marinobacter panjinensis]MCR8915405.1 aminotransferase class V-fold PLP-dependent enzyme [Marinobacter panjinensis]TKV66664.1 aminotransferase class V-fold PLP-dependent enzyme [Marinobacter panjinensis]
MNTDKAECGHLTEFSAQLARQLDAYLTFQHPDAMQQPDTWRQALAQPMPEDGIGIQAVLAELGEWVIPNGSPIPNPGCTAFITTGATTIGALATLAGSVAAPQRLGLTAFNFLEELSLDWMARMFGLPEEMKGLYSSGGSVANLVALGAARQAAFEALGIDPARDGIARPCRLYASAECHHSVQRAAAVLGMGRRSVCGIDTDQQGRMCPAALRRQLMADQQTNLLPVAVIANAGSTNRGAIDPLREIGETAAAYGIWFHVDGAYGLPGILDPRVLPLYDGLDLADSVIVDPHKWLGAPVGIGATYVKDRELLNRAFTQEAATYLEGACTNDVAAHSMDNLGIPYADMGVELSAPSRGAVVWALIREIGVAGLRERIIRHNTLARHVAERADAHPNLEVVSAPTLSICGIRYLSDRWRDLNELNRRIHRRMVQRGRAIPSTTLVNGTLAIRPCFVGARTTLKEADELVDEVLAVGQEVAQMNDEAAG